MFWTPEMLKTFERIAVRRNVEAWDKLTSAAPQYHPDWPAPKARAEAWNTQPTSNQRRSWQAYALRDSHRRRTYLRTNSASRPVRMSMPITRPNTGIQLPDAS
jgi:hypothetical protein